MLAALPIALILLLMIGFRWSAARAGSAALVAALALAGLHYGFGSRIMPELGFAMASLGVLAEATFTSMTILWIIFPALCIHEFQLRTGGTARLQQFMGQLSDDPRIVALLVAWFFVLFIEGAAGFGTSVALAAPFLVSAGFAPATAVAVSLIGHAVGVSFGAVGTPILPQVAAAPFTPLAIAATTANFHVVLGWAMPLIVMWLACRSMRGEHGKPLWGWALLASVSFLLPYYLLARFIGPELPTLAGSLAGVVLFILVLRARQSKRAEALDSPASSADLLKAAAPYITLIVLVLLTRLIPPLKSALAAVSLSWKYEDFSGTMQFLYHPGTMLLLSFMAGVAIRRASSADVALTMKAVGFKLLPVTVGLIAMLGLSRVMVHAGMIDALAVAAAGEAGQLWPLFAPAIGSLGTFVTGSATASNILFSEFQLATAKQLGFSALGLLAAQGVGAAIGNIICPHNIIAAAATVQLTGQEAEVLRKTIAVAIAYILLAGMLAYFYFA